MRWEFLSFQLTKLANTLNMPDDGIQVLTLVVTVASRSTNTSSISGSSLLPLAEGAVIHSFVDANGNSHHQVRHPIIVNRIRTKKYTKTHPCKHCGDGDLKKLTGFFCHLCDLRFCCPNAFGDQDCFLDHAQSIRCSREVASLVEGV